MINIISKMPDLKLLNLSSLEKIYDYGKTERDSRKLGHITLVDKNRKKLLTRVESLTKFINHKVC